MLVNLNHVILQFLFLLIPLSYGDTVGIWIPDVSDIKMVKSSLEAKWFGLWMLFESWIKCPVSKW